MASSRVVKHMSLVGCKPEHTFGRKDEPKIRHKLSSESCTHLVFIGLPSGIPGIGDEIEGAIQQAPQPLRHSMLDPSTYNQMKDNRICLKQNPDLNCGHHHYQACPQTSRGQQVWKQKGQHSTLHNSGDTPSRILVERGAEAGEQYHLFYTSKSDNSTCLNAPARVV